MKVLIYFSGRFNDDRGTPIRVRSVVTQLQQNGFDLYYALHDTPSGIPADRVLKLASPFYRAFQLIRFVREQRIDMVYVQTSAGIWYAPFITLFTRARFGVDFHSRLWVEEGYEHQHSAMRVACMEWLERLFARFAFFATSCSYTLRDYYQDVIPRHFVLPVVTDTTQFSPTIIPNEDLMRWKGDAVLIGYAGNTKWYQGVGTLLEAFLRASRMHPSAFKLLIISSSSPNEIETFVQENNLKDSVRILGKQSYEDIPALLASTDILPVIRPLNTLTTYSFPGKVSQYSALGKALVVSAVSDIGQYVQDRENGMIVPPEDPDAAATAFVALTDKSVRERIGSAARVLAEREFDLHAVGTRLAAFLQGVSR